MAVSLGETFGPCGAAFPATFCSQKNCKNKKRTVTAQGI